MTLVGKVAVPEGRGVDGLVLLDLGTLSGTGEGVRPAGHFVVLVPYRHFVPYDLDLKVGADNLLNRGVEYLPDPELPQGLVV